MTSRSIIRQAGGPRLSSTSAWTRVRDCLDYAGLCALAATCPQLAELLRQPSFWADYHCPELDLTTMAQTERFLALTGSALTGSAWSRARVRLARLYVAPAGLAPLARWQFANLSVESAVPRLIPENWTDDGWTQALAGVANTFPGVTDLDCSGITQLEDAWLSQLSSLSHLRRLSLGNCRGLIGSGLGSLPRTLEHLEIANCENLTQGLGDLPPSLRHLSLNNCPQIGDTALAGLKESLASLRHLEIHRGTGLTDAGLGELPSGLQHLDLSHCSQLTGEGLQNLPRGLQHLDLGWCSQVSTLFGLPPSLRYLDLTKCELLTDNELEFLPTSLLHLDLTGCFELTDGCFVYLSKLSHLQHLSLAECSRLEGKEGWSLPRGLQHLDLNHCL